MNFIIVHNVFLLLVIIVIKAIQPDCYKIKGSSVLLLETPLTRSKYISPYTHTQHLTRTSRTFYTFAVTKPLKYPFIGGESDVPWKERRDKFWIVGSRLRPYGDFSKHLRKSRTVTSAANQIQGEVHIHIMRSTSTKKRDK